MSSKAQELTRITISGFLVALMLTCCSCSSAASPPPPTGVFSISEGAGLGALICVPVEMRGHTYPFVIDTGTSVTTLDRSLESQLRILPGIVSINGKGSTVKAHRCEAPLLLLGGNPLPIPGPVWTLDLDLMRRISGENVMGIIGMDVLRSCRLRIDFGRHAVTFLPADKPIDPPPGGTCFALGHNEFGMPSFKADVLTHRDVTIFVDLGNVGSSWISHELFEQAEQEGIFVPGQLGESTSVNGTRQVRQGRFTAPISIAGVTHSRLLWSERPVNGVGLQFLARYDVIFDFPKNRLCLTPRTAAPIYEDAFVAGMTIEKDDGKVIIRSLKAGGPAEKAGVCAGDELLKVGPAPVSNLELWQIRGTLRSAEPAVRLIEVQRHGRILHFLVRYAEL